MHDDGLAGHFRKDKTIESVKDKYYWPRLRRNVNTIVSRCYVCQRAKGHTQNMGLYICYKGGYFYGLRVGFVVNSTRYGFYVCCG